MVQWGVDKILHMAACFLITAGTFLILLAARSFYNRNHENFPAGLTTSSHEYDVESLDNSNESATTTQCNFYRCIQKDWVLIAIASSVALVIGIVKEIGDAYNFWWLCQSKNDDGSIVGCDASWGDFLADVVGAGVASGFIFATICLWNSFREKNRQLLTSSYTITRSTSDT